MKVKVLYGSEACDYADEHTMKGAIRKVKRGDIDGMYCEYEFDTKHDAVLIYKILEDADGWNSSIIDIEE